MTARFQGPLVEPGTGCTKFSIQSKAERPADAVDLRGMLVSPDGLVYALNDTGQPRVFQDGIAIDADTGLTLISSGVVNNISMGGLAVDANGAVVLKDPSDVIHQGVAITNAGELCPAEIANFLALSVNSGGVIEALVKGVGSVTFARASEATVQDFEVQKVCLVNEIRVEKGRRAENIIHRAGGNVSSEDCTTTGWSLTNASGNATQNGNTFYLDSNNDKINFTVDGFTPDSTVFYTVELSCTEGSVDKSGRIRSFLADYWMSSDITLSPTTKRFHASGICNVSSEATNVVFNIDSFAGCTITVNKLHIGDVSGQANQNPDEYVSVGVITNGQYHGVGIDGVKQYTITNPNEVDVNNVVTETASTTQLTDWRFLFEPAAISYIAEPEDFTLGANWSATGNMSGSVSTTDASLQGRKLWKIAPTVGSTGTHTYISSTHTKAAAAQTWIVSAEIRPDDVEVPWIALTAENGAGSNFGRQFFRLSDGLVGTSSNSVWTMDASGSVALSNGSRRYWVKVTTNTDTSIRWRVSAADGDNGDFFNLDVGKGFLIQGANMVEESALSSYIPGSGSASYARAADIPNGMFDYANWSQTEGTWYVDAWFSEFVSEVMGIFSIANNDDGVLYKGGTADIRASDDGGATFSSVTIASATVDNQYRPVGDFGTGSTLEVGVRDVDGAGAFAWDGAPENYDGAFTTDSVINIAYNLSKPIRLRNLTGYTTRKGKDWVEDNL